MSYPLGRLAPNFRFGAGDHMRRYSEITIDRAAVHVVAPKRGVLTKTTAPIDLDDTVSEFLAAHVGKGLSDNQALAGRFKVVGNDRAEGIAPMRGATSAVSMGIAVGMGASRLAGGGGAGGAGTGGTAAGGLGGTHVSSGPVASGVSTVGSAAARTAGAMPSAGGASAQGESSGVMQVVPVGGSTLFVVDCCSCRTDPRHATQMSCW